jgi:hypothetical protein
MVVQEVHNIADSEPNSSCDSIKLPVVGQFSVASEPFIEEPHADTIPKQLGTVENDNDDVDESDCSLRQGGLSIKASLLSC